MAQKYNFQLDGVIVIDQPQLMPEDYSGVPIIDFNKNSIPIKQCLIIFAIPNEYAQMIMNQLRGMGFSVFVPINNHDANEIITFFQHNNYLLDKVKESFQGGGLKHTYILNTSDKSSLINKILSVSGFFVDGILNLNDKIFDTEDSLIIVPIENNQHKMIFNELNKANFSKILPLYNDDLKAVEIYFSLHNLFYSFFDFDDAPDFTSKYEKHAKFILNSYNMINISTLNIEDNSLVAKSIALSRAITDERILHVILPLDQNNQIVQSSNEGGGYLI